MRLGLSSGLSHSGSAGIASGLPPVANTKSLNFDGTNDVVTTTYTPSTIHSTGMTMSFWVKIANLSGFQIMGNWDDKGIFAGFDNSGRPDAYFGVQNVQKATTDISSYVSAGTWHHICVTASGASGVGTYYVDGVARDTLSYTADATKASITPIAIGVLQQSTGLAYYMEGDIDEVAVWDKGLSASEVEGIYNGGIPTDLTKDGGEYVSSSDLQSWWRMGDATSPAADGTSNLLFNQGPNGGLGSELITNGTFDTDVSSWSAWSGGTVTWSNGTAITGAVGTDDRGGMTQTLTTVTGAVYQVSFDILSRTSTKWEVYNQSANATLIEGTALGSHSTFFTAAGSSTQLNFFAKQAGTSDGTVAWDNISVKEVGGVAVMTNMTTSDIQTDTP